MREFIPIYLLYLYPCQTIDHYRMRFPSILHFHPKKSYYRKTMDLSIVISLWTILALLTRIQEVLYSVFVIDLSIFQ